MTTLDPTTSMPLPPDAIQRILYITPKVHVYAVPPLTSNKGYTAAQWTMRDTIFTARLRVLETAIPLKSSPSTSSTIPGRSTAAASSSTAAPTERVTVAILLEDPSTGDLFAAAPYNNSAAVSPCIDSSRFFAVRVVGDGGRKATLGIGFEERSDAFDFGVALLDAGKLLGIESGIGGGGGQGTSGRGVPGRAGPGAVSGPMKGTVPQQSDIKRDYSLKDGETITVNIGGKGNRARAQEINFGGGGSDATSPALFKIQPPPADGTMPFLPPPPSAAEVRRGMNKEPAKAQGPTAEELGFDDGEFGEFQ